MNNQAIKLKKENKIFSSGFFVKWEMILIYILLLINLLIIVMRPNLYFSSGTIQSIIQSGMDLSFMVLGMIFILMMGDIDISIASTMILSAMVIGLLYQAGFGALIAIIGGLLTGALCGFFNGFLIAKFKMPAVIVTISTSLLFRGIVKIILDVNVLKVFPDWFVSLSWDNFLGIPIVLIIFLLFSVIFSIVLHRSKFGRKLYAMGNSETVSQYSGIAVNRIKIIAFVIMGIMAAVSAIFFTGRLGGLSSTMAKGYELDVIAIAVLGGISTNGGKGKVYGPVISVLIITFLYYVLGLLGVDTNVRKIVTGAILIVAILLPQINRELWHNFKLKILYFDNKDLEKLCKNADNEIIKLKQKRKNIVNENMEQEEKDKILKEIKEKIDFIHNKCKEEKSNFRQNIKLEKNKLKVKTK